jgi:TrmH family RNA methyltransferase
LLKQIRRAQQQGALTEKGWMIAEGPHLVEEAWRSNLHITRAVVAEGVALPAGVKADRVIEVSDQVFRSISGTSTPQGILALVEPKSGTFASILGGTGAFACPLTSRDRQGVGGRDPEAVFLNTVPLVVVLDAVQDPGNAGAIARAAEAFGATGIVFAKGSVSPFHPKTIRASAGSLFRLGIVLATVEETATALAGRVTILAGVPHSPGVKAAWDADLTRPLAIVIGSEGRGVDPRFLKSAELVAIPTGGVESLNAAVAAGVLLYEAARQRCVE